MPENIDGVHVKNIAGEVKKQVLEPIFQYIGFLICFIHLTGLTGSWINNNGMYKQLLFCETWKEGYHQ